MFVNRYMDITCDVVGCTRTGTLASAGMSDRLQIVTGKGGVGRSAVTAAVALAAARSGQRVLAAAMTDSGGLAAHLGRPKLDYLPELIEPNLHAIAIDRARALDEYLKLQLGLGQWVPLMPLARNLQAMSQIVPGIRDVVTTGKLYHEVRSGSWDLVVADGPPTGQIMSYLRASRVIASLAATGRARDQADKMTNLLAAPDSSLIVVTLAEELPATETLEAIAELDDEALIRIGALFVNRTVRPLGVSETMLDEVDDDAVRDAGRLHRGIYEGQERWRRQLPDHVVLPLLFGEHDPAAVADQLSAQVMP